MIERLRAVRAAADAPAPGAGRGCCSTGGDRHVTAEQLHGEALAAAIPVSLATVYNTLHQFTEAGLLREVVVEPGRSYFDTNIADHHHFFCEAIGLLQDIPRPSDLTVIGLPLPPVGHRDRPGRGHRPRASGATADRSAGNRSFQFGIFLIC